MNHPGRLNLPITTGRPIPPASRTEQSPGVPAAGTTFREMLEESGKRAGEVTFSKHAQARVEQRGIGLSQEDLAKLSEAVDIAEHKGITDSLVFLNETAFIVNIKSKIVVTVVDSGDQSVFTNINGAVIL